MEEGAVPGSRLVSPAGAASPLVAPTGALLLLARMLRWVKAAPNLRGGQLLTMSGRALAWIRQIQMSAGGSTRSLLQRASVRMSAGARWLEGVVRWSAGGSTRSLLQRASVQMSAGARWLASVVQMSAGARWLAGVVQMSAGLGRLDGALRMSAGAGAGQRRSRVVQVDRVVQMSAGERYLEGVSDASRNMQGSRRLRAMQRGSRPKGVSFRGKRLRRNAGHSPPADLDLAQR